jgi:hypothetical protein
MGLSLVVIFTGAVWPHAAAAVSNRRSAESARLHLRGVVDSGVMELGIGGKTGNTAPLERRLSAAKTIDPAN